MKKMILIFCMGVFFFSCSNDDEPSNRDLLNGRHWILKEVESGPFGYYNDLFVASDFLFDKPYESISDDKRDIILWMLLLTSLACCASLYHSPSVHNIPMTTIVLSALFIKWSNKALSTLPGIIPIYFHKAVNSTTVRSAFVNISSALHSEQIKCTFCKNLI